MKIFKPFLVLSTMSKPVEGEMFGKERTQKKTGDSPGMRIQVNAKPTKISVRVNRFGRKTASLILFLSGFVVLLSSLVLFIGPPTHVGHFSDWRIMELGKCQWNAMHVMGGLLFLLAMLFHVYFNWKSIVAYLKNKRREMVVFTRPFTVALLLTVYVCVGTFWGAPPMNQIIQWLRSVKIGHVQTYGVPPYGQAQQAPLKSIAMYMGWDPQICMSTLQKKGFIVESVDQPMKQIAETNGLSIGAVVESMRSL